MGCTSPRLANAAADVGKTGAAIADNAGQVLKEVGKEAAVTAAGVGAVKVVVIGGRYFWMNGARQIVGEVAEGVAAKGVQAGEAGAFGALKGVKGDGLTAHHMPQAAAGRTGYNEGGALVMTHDEHVLTRTYGSKGIGTLQSDAGSSFRD